jgi:hypothetical protein
LVFPLRGSTNFSGGFAPYSFENNKNICYNNNIKKEVSFIKPISKIEEENPFRNLDIELEL